MRKHKVALNAPFLLADDELAQALSRLIEVTENARSRTHGLRGFAAGG